MAPDQEGCRKAAAECLELARLTTHADAKRVLLTLAREWLKLADYHHTVNFEHIVDDFNQQQMTGRDRASTRC
jgi:hypothetical protein